MSKRLLIPLRVAIIIISVVIIILSVFWLPDMAKRSAELNPEVAYLKYPILLGIYLTCIPFYIGVFHTLKVIRFIDKDDFFTEDASNSLRSVIFSAIVVIVLYMIGIIYLNVENALPPGVALLGITIIFVSFIIAYFAWKLKVVLIKK